MCMRTLTTICEISLFADADKPREMSGLAQVCPALGSVCKIKRVFKLITLFICVWWGNLFRPTQTLRGLLRPYGGGRGKALVFSVKPTAGARVTFGESDVTGYITLSDSVGESRECHIYIIFTSSLLGCLH